MSRRGVGLPRLFVGAVLTLVVLAALLATAAPSRALDVTRLSDRVRKLNMLNQLTYKPTLYFFGGSRSLRIPPSFARRYAGIKAFNFAVQEATTEDYWAVTHYIERKFPTLPLHIMWGVQSNMFADRQMDAGLVRDSRLSRYFPADLLQAQLGGTPHYWRYRRYAADGHVVYDNYDRMIEDGRTLDRALEEYIQQALRKLGTGIDPDNMTRAKRYFLDGLAYLNSRGCEPLVMMMPVHPRVIRALKAADPTWTQRHAEFLAYLISLQRTYHFTVLDFTYITSFGGDPNLFFDGVHMMQENSRRLLKAAIDKAPWAFGLAPAPWERMHSNGAGSATATPAPTPTPSPSVEASDLIRDPRFGADDRKWPILFVPAQ